MALPFVSIIMPCFNEEKYIEACMASLAAQDYPSQLIEILVADGGSTDRTLALLEGMSRKDTRIRIIDNPERLQAPGMNRAIRASRGDILIRMDVHAEYAEDFVRRCVEVLEETGAENVGGAARPKSKQWFQRALSAALESPLGVGGSSYRSPDKEGPVDTVFPGAFRRRVFETIGLFDPKAITNEDAEINQRILESGGVIYLSKKIIVHYYPRDSFKGLAIQYFKYGKGRARTLLKHRRLPTIRPLIPFLMTSSGALLAGALPFHPLTWLSFGAYGAGTFLEAVRVGHKAGAHLIPVVWAIFPVLHVSHGVGMAVGLVSYALHPDWEEQPDRLAPRVHPPRVVGTA